MTPFTTAGLVIALLIGGQNPRLGQDGQSPEYSAVKLKYAAAADLVAVLGPVFKGRESGFVLVAEPISNTILVSAPLEKRDHVLRLIAEFDALSKVKHFVIEVRVCQGDPLGGKGDITVLSRPTLMVSEGQPGMVSVRTALDGFDDFVGIAVRCRATRAKDGAIRVEIFATIAELMDQSKERHEIRSCSARQERDLRHGETFNMRMRISSASDQTWLEATVKAVK
jgi:Bacterial type II/III secretion system short domain